MKSVIAGLVITIVCFSFSNSWAENKELLYKSCAGIANAAETVMTNRQLGIAMQKMIKVVNKEDNKIIRNEMLDMVIRAYETPRYSTKKMKNEAISDFRDMYYLHCIKSIR